MKTSVFFYSILFILLISTINVNAQEYFRSKASGNWNDMNTWESSMDGSNWTDATSIPNANSNTITIRAGHNVSVTSSIFINQVVVDTNAILTVSKNGLDTASVAFRVNDGPGEPDMTVYGRVVATGPPNSGSPFSVDAIGIVSFEDGSFYEHNQNGGGIPISTWKPGSTILFNAVTDTPPANKAQNYSNIIVDLPNLTFNYNMGFNENIISGNINILNTGNFRFVLVGPATNETRTVTIMGDINQSAGTFNSHGTENPNSIAILHTYGNINVTGGNFSVVRGAQGGTGTTTWFLHGNVSLSNCVTQNGNPTGGKFVFMGPGEQMLSFNNVTFAEGGFPIEVADSTILNLGTSILKGNGIFTLNSTSELKCGHPGGIDSILMTTGPINLFPGAGYIFNGTTPQVTGLTKLPGTLGKLTVDNPAGVTLGWEFLIEKEVNILSGNLFLDGKSLVLGTNAILNESGGTVKGEGRIITTREINAPAALNVGGMGAEITSSANLGMTQIERFHVPALINSSSGVARRFRIVPANNTMLNATLRIYYDESELDTIPEANLSMYSSEDDISWILRGGMVNTENNYVELSAVDNFSFWTLGYNPTPVSVEDDLSGIPDIFTLYQNYPNPFNPETVIRFDLPEESFVNLSVFNLIGEKVQTIINEKLDKGKYARVFSAENLPSGIYIYKLKSDKSEFTKKMILLR